MRLQTAALFLSFSLFTTSAFAAGMSGMPGMSKAKSNPKSDPAANKGAVRVRFTTTKPLIPGTTSAFALRVENAQRQDIALQSVHEKKAHIIVVSNALDEFTHTHPGAEHAGAYPVKYAPLEPGAHTAFVELTPVGRQTQIRRFPLTVAGVPPKPPALKVDLAPKLLGSTSVELSFDALKLKAKKTATITFALTNAKTGAPQKLGKFLGATGHAIVISRDRTQFLHLHAMEGMGTMSMPGMEMPMPAASPAPAGTVQFRLTLPAAGLYKVWGQFEAGGKTLTAPFVVRAT